MAKIIDGRKIAAKVLEEVKLELGELAKRKVFPSLAVVLVGNDPGSQIYVNSKEKKAKELGIASEKIILPENTSEKELLALIGKLNKSKKVNGILVQFPLPKQISERTVRDAISPEKDVDGLNSTNIGKLLNGDEMLAPCTPKGIIRMLEEEKIGIEGKNAVVVGRSLLVGKPIANMLLNRNATVTICHSKTRDLGEVTGKADILVVAVGKPNLIKGNMVKEGAIVIDVGMNRLTGETVKEDVSQKEGSKLVGDVDFQEVALKVRAITPVPGGVGPMTIAMLMRNTVNCAKLQNKI
ncbi:MAG: bifunctional methylenetetrahydrofolate dehydrogenase/methenyltetrahydrofolate cyclohydrolase FolD [Candidatus Micrarchaeota archaeon]